MLIRMKLIFFMLVICGSASAQSSFFNSPVQIENFANHLYCEKDYLRAVEEYRRYLNTGENDTISLKIVLSLYKMGRFDEAASVVDQTTKKSVFCNDAEYIKLVSLYRSKTDENFKGAISSARITNDNWFNNIEKLLRFDLFLTNSLLSESFMLLPFKTDEKTVAKNFYERKQNPPYKSPLTAALFSAIVPGSGKIYAGKTSDGILAFLTTGVFTFLAYDNFNAKHNFRGWLFGGLAALFYAGNVYGSAAAAQIYNAGIKFNFENDIEIYLNKKNYYLPEYDFCK